MDTAPLPRIPPDPESTRSATTTARPAPHRVSGGLRALEMLAGLASGGLVVIGLGLVALQLLAPQLAPGEGLAAPAGPTWLRALAQLGAGLAGEGVVLARDRLGTGPRAWLAAAVVVMTAVVLWFCWWA